jgi:hypothetical protein
MTRITNSADKPDLRPLIQDARKGYQMKNQLGRSRMTKEKNQQRTSRRTFFFGFGPDAAAAGGLTDD